MKKLLKNILAVVILYFLARYLSQHWQELKVLLKFGPVELLLLCVATALGTMNNSRINQLLLRALGTKAFFWDLVLLQNTTRLLNYVPMKAGTIFRGNYLKRRYGLSYTHYTAFFAYFTFLMTLAAAVVGFCGIIIVYGYSRVESKILIAFFLVLIIGSLFILFVPLPVPAATGRFSQLLRNFLMGRKNISRNAPVVGICLIHLLGTFVLSATRLGIIYHSMDMDIHPVGYLILGALGYASLILGLTPGALGIREVVLGAGAVAVGVPLQVGLLAAMFDRAIIISWTLVIGGLCTIWLWRRCPTDFKNSGDLNNSRRLNKEREK